MPEMLTLREVAQLLRKHPETIRRWHRQGRFPAGAKIGKGWLFRRDEVEKWLASRFHIGPQQKLEV